MQRDPFSVLPLAVASLCLAGPGSAPAQTPGASSTAKPDPRPRPAAALPRPAAAPSLIREHRPASRRPVSVGLLVNLAEPGISAGVNKLVLVSPILLIGDGLGACVIAPQAYGLTGSSVGGAGALVGFRVFSRRPFHGFYFGVRFGGGVGNHSFKTFMGQLDAGWLWPFGRFRLGLGINAGGGYFAHDADKGGLYLFSLDLSVGFAMTKSPR